MSTPRRSLGKGAKVRLMKPEELKKIIVLDDLDTEQIVKETVGKSPFAHVSVQRLAHIDTVEQQLNYNAQPESLLLIINAHLKDKSSDFRYQRRGVKFVCNQLRAEWERLEPVIVYAPLSDEEFLSVPDNLIFNHYQNNHAYLSTPSGWSNLSFFIERVEAISSLTRLDEIKRDAVDLQSRIRIYKHDLDAALQFGRVEEIISISQTLRRLIPDEFHGDFKIDELLAECECLAQLVKPSLETIEAITKDYSPKANLLFKSWED
jgi:hypothetical protein